VSDYQLFLVSVFHLDVLSDITLPCISSYYLLSIAKRDLVYRLTTSCHHTRINEVSFCGCSTGCLSLVYIFFLRQLRRFHQFFSPSIAHIIRAGPRTPPTGAMSASSVHPYAHLSPSSATSSSLHPSLHGPSPSSSPHVSLASTSGSSSAVQSLSFVHTHAPQSNTHQSYASLEEACTRTILNVFCRLIALPLTGGSPYGAIGNATASLAERVDSDSAHMKTKACFILREPHFAPYEHQAVSH